MVIEMNTKEKIIFEATKEFAEKGYKCATIRAICRRAGVNLASVNYHFSSKEALYRNVFATMMSHDRSLRHRLDQDWDGNFVNWRSDLKSLLKEILLNISDEDPMRRYKCMIFGRELLEPSPIFHELFSDYIKPILDEIAIHMCKVLPKNLSDKDLYMEVFSVISECVFYLHAKAIVKARFPDRNFIMENIDDIIEHSLEKTCLWIKHRIGING